jgi:hypothetical protein
LALNNTHSLKYVVGDSFAEDLIPDMPSDNKVQDFGDYVVSTYVDDNAIFPPSVWAEIPSKSKCKHTAFC